MICIVNWEMSWAYLVAVQTEKNKIESIPAQNSA